MGQKPRTVQAFPEVLREMEDCFSRILERFALAQEIREPLTKALVATIQEKFRGCLIYLPTGKQTQLAQRAAAICREFDGSNQAQLARRHDVTVHTVYAILAKARRLHATKDDL